MDVRREWGWPYLKREQSHRTRARLLRSVVNIFDQLLVVLEGVLVDLAQERDLGVGHNGEWRRRALSGQSRQRRHAHGPFPRGPDLCKLLSGAATRWMLSSFAAEFNSV